MFHLVDLYENNIELREILKENHINVVKAKTKIMKQFFFVSKKSRVDCGCKFFT